MPIVEMPDGAKVSFPEDMPKHEIKNLIISKFPELGGEVTHQEKQPSFAGVKPQGDAGGMARAGIYGLNTAVPFGNVISSGIGAGIAKGASAVGLTDDDRTYGELYDQALLDTRATTAENPYSAGAGMVGGAVSTLPIAGAKALSGVRSFVGGGSNLASKALRGAVVGSPISALYGAGEAEQGNRLEGAKTGAYLGAGLGAGLPVSGALLGSATKGTKNIIKGFKSRGVDELEHASQLIRDKSSKAYKKVKDSGFTFRPKALKKMAFNIEKDLTSDGLLSPRRHGEIVGILQDFKNEARKGRMGFEDLDMWRQELSDVASKFLTEPAQARKAKIAIRSLDNAIEGLTDESLGKYGANSLNALKLARSEWSKKSKFDTITDIVRDANGDANTLKRKLSALTVTNAGKKKIRGFSPDEMDLLKEASQQTTGEGILKMLGKFGFDIGSSRAMGNTALPLLGAGAGFASGGGGATVALPAIGTAARLGQKWVAKGKVEKLLQLIESGGNVSMKDIGKLPPADGKRLLRLIKGMTTAQSIGNINKRE